ncbi:cathepsin F-like [Carcharodon carcharias]|uniref:cathepsin F-like n=1 Tax=Carcharodon carcharias TaxID=13397 RepID=UPI001B7E5BEE|nr:cathepsin F-like [Carcharodon carcharias]
MFRVAVICLALSCNLLHAEAGPEEDNIEVDDEAELRSKFEEFKEQYKKNYDQEEEEKRFRIFVENLKAAKRMQELDAGTAIYGITKFSDMSDEEFGAFYLNPIISNNNDTWPEEAHWTESSGRLTNLSAPVRFNWKKMGAVTKVKDQRRCGCCWAFGAVANIESMWFIKTKQLKELSEQELVDCDTLDKGCKGGYPYNAFNSIVQLGGMMRSKDYRYKGRMNVCTFKPSEVIAKIQTYRNIRPHEEEMAAWLARKGPIVVTMNAGAMKGYRRGISRPDTTECNPAVLDHVVLIVGYGVARGHPYWIIKNSWGADWGEEGYFRLYRGERACGINKYPVTAIV